jgi:glycogen(starch) synthase
MNICFICNEYPPAPYGGIGNGTRLLSRALVRAGHKVRVVGVYREKHAGTGFEMDQGVEVYRIPLPQRDAFSIRARVKLFQMVSGWAAKHEIDIVEVPDPEGWAAGWPALAVPLTGRIHGSVAYFADEMERSCSKLTYFVERASLRRANCWSSVSGYAENKTRKIFGLQTKGTVLYPAVQLPEPASWESRSANRVVYAGTLTLKKGILSLVKAWPLVRKQSPGAELHVFGKETTAVNGQPMSAFLLSHVDEDAKSSIVFHGHAPKTELVDALRTSRAAVFPSYAEAFAATPMEAMAEGCPTVYSSRTSGRELMEHGVDGLLIDPDKLEEIANALLLLLRDEAFARRIGEAGREKIRRQFTDDKVVTDLIGYYTQCIQGFSGQEQTNASLCSSR